MQIVWVYGCGTPSAIPRPSNCKQYCQQNDRKNTYTHPAHKTLYGTIHIYTFIIYTDGQTKLAVVRCSFYLALPKGLAMAREFLI